MYDCGVYVHVYVHMQGLFIPHKICNRPLTHHPHLPDALDASVSMCVHVGRRGWVCVCVHHSMCMCVHHSMCMCVRGGEEYVATIRVCHTRKPLSTPQVRVHGVYLTILHDENIHHILHVLQSKEAVRIIPLGTLP